MNILPKILNWVKSSQYHIFLALCIGLISLISFNLGKMTSGEKGSIKITEGANIYQVTKKQAAEGDPRQGQEINNPSANSGSTAPKTTPKPLDMRVVVSKASTSKKYHYSWCSSWKRITAKNQLWFENEEAAIAAGYTLAGNCSK